MVERVEEGVDVSYKRDGVERRLAVSNVLVTGRGNGKVPEFIQMSSFLHKTCLFIFF